MIGIAGIAGLFLPEVETREEVARWDGMIGALEHARGVNPGALKLVLSIESALGVLNAHVMATVAARVVSLTFGGAQDGDLNTDLGCAWSIDGPEMLHARAHTLLAARAARFDSPLDGVFANVRDAEGFSATPRSPAARLPRAQAHHPAQIEPCNRLYRPSAAEPTITPVAGGIRPGGRARQRLDHRRRPHDRPCDGQCRAPRAGRRSAWKGRDRFCEERKRMASAFTSTNYRLALPKGAVSCSNSSMTVPASLVRESTVMRWPSAVRTLAMRRGCSGF